MFRDPTQKIQDFKHGGIVEGDIINEEDELMIGAASMRQSKSKG